MNWSTQKHVLTHTNKSGGAAADSLLLHTISQVVRELIRLYDTNTPINVVSMCMYMYMYMCMYMYMYMCMYMYVYAYVYVYEYDDISSSKRTHPFV